MKVITIEANTFETMMERFEHFTKKVDTLCQLHSEKNLKVWLDNQDVCQLLNISKRTLQTYRDNGLLAYSQINRKIYYKQEDILKMMQLIIRQDAGSKIYKR